MISQLKSVLKKFPLIYLLLKKWKSKKKFSNEIRFLNGRCQPKSSRQSIIFFSIYRSASTYIGRVLGELASESGLIPINLDAYFFHMGKGREWEGEGRKFVQVTYRSKGFYYGPFRSFNSEIPRLEDYKILLVLRDPRDAIVSSYYAMYSHAVPQSYGKRKTHQVWTRRKQRLRQALDEYVMEKTNPGSGFLRRYSTYHEKLIGKENVLFMKYEDIVANFSGFLDRIVEFCELDISPGLLKTIRTEANFSVPTENIYDHKRQVTPGDHRRKLAGETIDSLNKRLADVLKLFDYPV